MPVEARPIFRPDVIRLPILGYTLPDSAVRGRAKLQNWARIIAGGAVDAHKEAEILGDFLNDIFCELLGYIRTVDSPGGRYTFSREKHVQANGKFADAVLGEFDRSSRRYVAALEGKGPKDPLDRPFAGRKVSAVDQAYDYAINLRCPWILVTNIRQTRLYYKGADKQTYERFDTEALAADDRQLRKFVFLLHAGRMVPAHGPCHLDALFSDSEKVGREVTKEVYDHYAFIRRSTLTNLRRANPGVEPRLVLACAQKLLDRILFVAFCEDRGLLPPETISRAHAHRDPYNPRPLWENFRGMFRAIDAGSGELNIPRYNGGLFAEDPVLDHLVIPDNVLGLFNELAEYDFRPASAIPDEEVIADRRLVDVEILGHIFEQSLDDLEKLRAEIENPSALLPELEPEPPKEKVSRRKREGAFYTPDYVTRYIVEQAMGGVLRDRFERLRADHAEKARGTARAALTDPRAYDLDALKDPQRKALRAFWEDWQQVLGSIRILDPACGSGAFLIEAFDQLHAEYQRTNDRVRELRGHSELFDLDRKILQDNLYGVDLNDEAVHIARLSLWIKTAVKGKELTSLDRTLRVGNSIVADSSVDPRAFDWRAAFPEVFDGDRGGFDVVVGNPPYIRQEWLSPIKPYLQSRYAAYHGMADLYVYFYELGLDLLRPGGRLSYIVTNKWMKAGYGEPLRGLFARKSWVESVVDFGHAKQIFPDADVFPSIIVARRPDDSGIAPETTRVCAIPRDQLRIDDLSVQIEKDGVCIERRRLMPDAWHLDPSGAFDLLAKIRGAGIPIAEFAGAKPLYGVKTGLNEAFVLDSLNAARLIREDERSSRVLRKFLRGQDIARWSPEWAGQWMIFMRRGLNIDEYPAIKRHLESYRDRLEPRPKDWNDGAWSGRKPGAYKWFEIQDPVEYWEQFEKPKLYYQVIQYHSSYCLDCEGYLGNDKTFFIPVQDYYLLGVLNSPLMWWHNWRYLTHLKDEALSPMGYMMEQIPIAVPRDEIRSEVGRAVSTILGLTKSLQEVRRDLLDWLKVEHEIPEPSQRLRSALELDGDAFVTEVRKVRGKKNPLSLAGLRGLRDEHARTIVPAQALAREASGLERSISDLVNAAYGLTPDEVALMWETAPPRMPVAGP